MFLVDVHVNGRTAAGVGSGDGVGNNGRTLARIAGDDDVCGAVDGGRRGIDDGDRGATSVGGFSVENYQTHVIGTDGVRSGRNLGERDGITIGVERATVNRGGADAI